MQVEICCPRTATRGVASRDVPEVARYRRHPRRNHAVFPGEAFHGIVDWRAKADPVLTIRWGNAKSRKERQGPLTSARVVRYEVTTHRGRRRGLSLRESDWR